jgi:hypothetical protein
LHASVRVSCSALTRMVVPLASSLSQPVIRKRRRPGFALRAGVRLPRQLRRRSSWDCWPNISRTIFPAAVRQYPSGLRSLLSQPRRPGHRRTTSFSARWRWLPSVSDRQR